MIARIPPRPSALRLLRSAVGTRHMASASPTTVKIVEVSPRDGLQNEANLVPTEVKLELIRRLERAGATCVESGAFVSPKWVPQMGDTPRILDALSQSPSSVSHPFLVPNVKGLDSLLAALEKQRSSGSHAATDEIAIFSAATDAFTKANTNCTTAESLERLSVVAEKALAAGLKVRGYVSVVAGCPYQGRVDPSTPAAVAKALLDMGCYEVSLGDTVGVGSPSTMLAVLNECTRHADASRFAAHCHDTFGSGLANVLAMVGAGVRTVDSAVGGLGGCPYSPGATGNIDTESVVHALHSEGYQTGIDLVAAAEAGQWISEQLGRPNGSSAGRALLARKRKAEADKAKL